MSNHDQTARGEFSPLWSVPASVNNKPIIANNVLYTSTGNNTTALNASTGALLWQMLNRISTHSMVDSKNGAIYTLAMKTSDGSVLWASSDVSASPRLMNNDVVYFALSSYKCNQPNASDVYALQASNGHDLWHVHL